MGEWNDFGAGERRPPAWADAIARRFHEEYERLAPEFGYQTREESAVPWSEVPTANKDLMRAVVAQVFYKADPFNKGGHGRGCWMQSGGPCDCTASDGDHFRVRRGNGTRKRQPGPITNGSSSAGEAQA